MDNSFGSQNNQAYALCVMANKYRPKKVIKSYYRKYTYGVSRLGNDSNNFHPIDEQLFNFGREVDLRKVKGDLDYDTYDPSLLFREPWYGYVWPLSKFQKIDVLKVALALKKGFTVLPPWLEIQYEKEIENKRIEREGMRLPFEIIVKILEFTEPRERLNQLLICRSIYCMLLRDIYCYPKLDSTNFNPFVELLTDRENKGKFDHFVKILDLSNIIQVAKTSYVGKLIRRCSKSLEMFISSQSNFGLTSLISLRNCEKLRILDLSLVSGQVDLKELFRCICNLHALEQLSFPRSSIRCENYEFEWPRNLWYLKLQGGITDEFLMNSVFPSTITSLEFAYCPNVSDEGVNDLLSKIGTQLERLSVFYPMPMLSSIAFDFALLYCPNLKMIYASISYISNDLFRTNYLPPLADRDRPLKHIIIDSPGQVGEGAKIDPDEITTAICEDRLPSLHSLTFSRYLGWNFTSAEVQDLVYEMENRGGEVFQM